MLKMMIRKKRLKPLENGQVMKILKKNLLKKIEASF